MNITLTRFTTPPGSVGLFTRHQGYRLFDNGNVHSRPFPVDRDQETRLRTTRDTSEPPLKSAVQLHTVVARVADHLRLPGTEARRLRPDRAQSMARIPTSCSITRH